MSRGVVSTVTLTASYYQQFDADLSRAVPGEAYGGWRQAPLEVSLDHTGVVLMHAWDTGSAAAYPGWYRAVEYLPRAEEITRTVLPPLLRAVRASPMPLFHVVGGGRYYQEQPGYRRARELAARLPDAAGVRGTAGIEVDESLSRLRAFRAEHVFPGAHNVPDIERGTAALGFAPGTAPVGDEGVAEDSRQLLALCRDAGVNHLLYAGFALNWCLLRSPGGMSELSGCGVMCSALRQAVTSVENRETARSQAAHQLALWQVALAFGFVFEVDDLIAALA